MVSMSWPMGVTQPMPVTTTRRLMVRLTSSRGGACAAERRPLSRRRPPFLRFRVRRFQRQPPFAARAGAAAPAGGCHPRSAPTSYSRYERRIPRKSTGSNSSTPSKRLSNGANTICASASNCVSAVRRRGDDRSAGLHVVQFGGIAERVARFREVVEHGFAQLGQHDPVAESAPLADQQTAGLRQPSMIKDAGMTGRENMYSGICSSA